MRTTLDIDDDVLHAAKELARAERTTAGRILSDLARSALTSTRDRSGPPGPGGTLLQDGWYVFPSRGGIITKEMVDSLLEEAELQDAGIAERK